MSENGQLKRLETVSFPHAYRTRPHRSARERRLLPGDEDARRALRRVVLHRGDLHRHLLPAGVPREAAAARELPLLPPRGAGRGRGLSPLPALPARAGPARERAASWSTEDASRILALQAARLIDEPDAWAEDGPGAAQIAARLGVSDRHLRRIFEAQFGVSPLQYLQTRRLLAAKQLIADTRLPMTQVALASGFASVRRFNAAFVEHYGLNPSALRRAGGAAPKVAPPRPSRCGWAFARPTTPTPCSASSRAARCAASRWHDGRRQGTRQGQHAQLCEAVPHAARPAGRAGARRLAAAALRPGARAGAAVGQRLARRRAADRHQPRARPVRPRRRADGHQRGAARGLSARRRPARARHGRRLRAGGARGAGPAGHRGRGAHAGLAPGRGLRRTAGHAGRRARPAVSHARGHRRGQRRRTGPARHRAAAAGRAARHRPAGERRQAGAACGGRRALDHRGAAGAARHRRLDRAVHRHARAALARRLPGRRHRAAEGAGRDHRARRQRGFAGLAAVAQLRGAARMACAFSFLPPRRCPPSMRRQRRHPPSPRQASPPETP
jgi:AraC-like DNA-binding protein